MKRIIALLIALAIPLAPLAATADQAGETSPAVAVASEQVSATPTTDPSPIPTLAPISSPASASEARTVDVAIFTQDQVLELPRNTVSFWFSVPEGTVLGDQAEVRLHIDSSDTLINERSSITLSLNGVRLATRLILDIENDSRGELSSPGLTARNDEQAGDLGSPLQVAEGASWWIVETPSENVRTDGTLNELTFTTAQRSIEGDCADIDNPANWVKLLDDSYLRLNIQTEGIITLAGAMRYMYDTLENTGELSTEVVLDANPSETEISAMLQSISAVGLNYPYRDDIDVSVSNGEESKQNNNKLYVGLDPVSWTDAPALSPGQGYIASSRLGAINRLWITGADGLGIKRAAGLLSRQTLLSQVSGNSVTVGEDLPDVQSGTEYRENGLYTLADFGYESVNLAGAFHQQTSFTLTQPNGMISGQGSYIQIHYRHSEALISDNSLLTVYISGTPLASAKLSASNASGGVIKVAIPQEALDDETISVRIDVYNYLGRLDCSKDYYDTAWTVIDKSSVVYLQPGTQPITPSLKNFPTMNAKTCVAVASDAALSLAAATALRAGQQGGKAVWQYAESGELDNPRADADIVILSDNESLALPSSLSESFPIMPLGNGAFKLQKETGLIGAIAADKVIVQVIRAPWSYTNRVYLITYPAGGEQAALDMLGKKKTLEKLEGQAALVSPTGSVSALEFDTGESSVDAPLTWERIKYIAEVKTGYGITWLLAMAALLIVIVILIIVVGVNHHSRFINAKKNIELQNKTVEKDKDGEDNEDDENDDPDDEQRFHPRKK